MATVGYAALQIVPSMKGATKKIEAELNGVSALGGRAGTSLGNALKAGAKVGVGAAVVGIAGLTAVVGSFIPEAIAASDATDKFKSTLDFAGIKPDKIDALTKSTKAYADLTVYELGDIQQMTAQLGANGVKGFEKLAEATGNLNAVAGGNAETFKRVGMAMTQTAGAGKLTTENWNQIADAIPGASGLLQKAMLDNAAYTGNFRDAMAKGQITADEFNAAVTELGMTDVAKKAATSTATIEGAVGNLQASITGGLMATIDKLKPSITKALGSLSTIADKAFTALGGHVDKVLPSIEKFVDGFGSGGGASGIKDFFAALSPLGSVLKGLGPALADVGDTLTQVGAAVGGALSAALPAVADSFVALATSLGGALATALPSLSPAFVAIGDALVAVAPAAGELATALGDSLASALPSLVPLVGTLADAVAGLAPALGDVVTWLASVATGLVDFAAPILSNETAVASLVGALIAWKAAQAGLKFAGMTAELWKNIAAWRAKKVAMVADKTETLALKAMYAGDFLKSLASQAVAIAKSTAAWIANTASLVANKAAAAGSWLLGIITSLGTTVLSVGAATGAWIANTAAMAANKAGQLAAAAASAVVRGAVIAWTAAQWLLNVALNANPIGLVVAAIALLVGAFVLAWKKSETFRNIVIGAWNAIKAATSAVWNAVKKVVEVVWSFIVAYVKTYIAIVKAVVTGVWNAIKTVTSTVWNAVKGAVTGAVNGVKSVVSTVFGSVKKFVSDVWNKVKSLTTDAWNGVKDAVTKGVTSVVDFVKGMPGKIIDGLGDLGSTLYSAGKDVINGFLNGIKNMAGNVISTIKSTVTDKLPGFVKDALGIASPSKVFAAIGKWIPAGLAVGIKGNADDVTKALKGVTDRITKAGEAAVKKEADRLIAARKKANAKISASNKSARKKRDRALEQADKITDTKKRAAEKKRINAAYKRSVKDALPSLSAADAKKQATKNVKRTLDRAKAANKLVKAQDKLTKGTWKGGANAGTDRLLASLNDKGKFKKGAKVQSATLADFAKAREVLAGRLSAAQDKLADAVKLRDDFKNAVVDNIKGFTSLLGAQAKEVGQGYASVLTAGDITSHMRDRLAQTKKFSDNMAKLLASGLNKETYAELISKGPEAAGAYAQALVNGGSSAVKDVNSLTSQINTAANALGNTSSSALYQAGVDSAQGLVNGIESQMSKLDTAAGRVADTLVAAVKKKLGIKSPSRVLAALGRFTMTGFGLGVSDPSTVKRATRLTANAANKVVNGFEQSAPLPTLALPKVATPNLPDPGAPGDGRGGLTRADLEAIADLLRKGIGELPPPVLKVGEREFAKLTADASAKASKYGIKTTKG